VCVCVCVCVYNAAVQVDVSRAMMVALLWLYARYPHVCSRMLTHAMLKYDVCRRMVALLWLYARYPHVSSRILTYAHVCSRMLC
jgi:hypothetical protein